MVLLKNSFDKAFLKIPWKQWIGEQLARGKQLPGMNGGTINTPEVKVFFPNFLARKCLLCCENNR